MRCDLCGRTFRPHEESCPQCGNRRPTRFVFSSPRIPSPPPSSPPNKNLQVLTILLLIFFYPFGIPFMWVMGCWSRRTRIWITLAFLVAIILGFIMILMWTSGPYSNEGHYV